MTCSIPECGEPVRVRGRCESHYHDWRMARFWTRIDKRPDGCWLWTGPPNTAGTGYGQVTWDGKNRGAHVIAYEALVGPVPDGLHLDHLCRRTLCCNPDHLEPVTCRENVHRGEGPAGVNARKTHCIRGHAFDAENTGRDRHGDRWCRACARERHAARAA